MPPQRKPSGPARKTETLRPDHWSETYERRPRYDLCVGLRTLSVTELEDAKAEASRFAAVVDNVDDFAERYNNKLMAWAVARAHCDPNDVSRSLPELGMRGDDEIEDRLMPEAVRMLWDALQDLHSESRVSPPATDDEVAELAAILTSPTRADIDADTRRLLGRALRALRVSDDPTD